MRHGLILVCITGALVVAAYAAWPAHHVTVRRIVLMIGQSNMNGLDPDLLDDGPADPLMELFGNDYVLHPGFCEPYDCAVAGVGSCTGEQVDAISVDPDPGYGPAVAFARAFLDAFPNDPVTVVPCAMGATWIDLWRPPAKRFDRSTLLGSCLARAAVAEQIPGIVSLVIYNQGEAEAANVAAWSSTFPRIVAATRREFGAVPFVLARLPEGFLGGRTNPAPLRAAQEAAAAMIPDLALVSSDSAHTPPEYFEVAGESVPLLADALHISAAGQRVMGHRYARAGAALLNGAVH